MSEKNTALPGNQHEIISSLNQGLLHNMQGALNKHFGPQPNFEPSELNQYFIKAEQRALERLASLFYKEQLFKQVGHVNENGKFNIHVSLPNEESLILHQVQSYCLSHIEIHGVIEHLSPVSRTKVQACQYFLDLFNPQHNPDCEFIFKKWQQFCKEVENDVLQEALFLAHRHYWEKQLKQEILEGNHPSFWHWIEEQSCLCDCIKLFEQWGAQGHPFHPNPKAKLGLTLEEVLNYSPEYQQQFAVYFVALHRSNAFYHRPGQQFEPLDYFHQYFPECMQIWQQELTSRGHAAVDYIPLPVHPWQYEHVLPDRFATLIKEQKLILIDQATINAEATLSLRTIIPESSQPHPPHIKLPVGFFSTSVMRTVSPGSVRMSPRMSVVLQRILEKEKNFNHTLDLMPDFAGIHLQEDDDNLSDNIRFLGTLLRSNPCDHLQDRQVGLVVASLFVDSPTTNTPILFEILRYAGMIKPEQVKHFFQQYVTKLIQAFLDLYLIYGIALEAHQQNTLAIFNSGHLSHFLIRDLGGIRVHTPTLEQQGYPLERDIPTLILTDNLEEVGDKFLHAVMQSQIMQLIHLLVKHFYFKELELWQVVREIISTRFEVLKERAQPDCYTSARRILFEKSWPIKSFTRMRLSEQGGYIFVNSNENPLSS